MKQEVIDAIHAQLAQERDAAVVYESLAIWCATHDYPGFADFFKKQAKEEQIHAAKLVDHLIDRGVTPVLGALQAPPNNFGGLIEIANAALDHEMANTHGVHVTLQIATAKEDYAAMNLMNLFVNEQVEEEVWANRMIALIKRSTCAGSINSLDRHIVKDLTGGE
jgi:ferritin